MKTVLINSITMILALFTLTSCAMKSGRYVQRGNKWVFVSSKTGFQYYYNKAQQDNSNYVAEPGRFMWPVPTSKRISSFYGPRHGRNHDGIDIPAKRGAHVLAADSGKVIHSGWMRGYGRIIVVDHGEGFHTVYAHNTKNMVKKNQKVSRGEVIAKVGSSGRSSGPHLHFEIRKNNKVRDPALYINWVRQRRLAKK
jgi:murein DD-endopeptidase MepM/ murein hydrolase activator NlpD